MKATYLEALRAICAFAQETPYPLWTEVDPDLSHEAGMDGNYAKLLMAARRMDRIEVARMDSILRLIDEIEPD